MALSLCAVAWRVEGGGWRVEGGVFKPRVSATLKTKVRLLFDAGKAVSRTKYPSEFLQSD
jgi:hypothetical protein